MQANPSNMNVHAILILRWAIVTDVDPTLPRICTARGHDRHRFLNNKKSELAIMRSVDSMLV